MPGAVFINGENVNLRTIEEEDLKFLRDNYNNPEILPNLTWEGPRNLEQKRELFEQDISSNERIDLLITRDEDAVGWILLIEKDEGVAEIGISIDPEFQRNGYGTEASELIIDYAFNQLRYEKIFVRVYESNKASQRVWDKLGFVKEGELRRQIFKNGDFEDAYIYGLLKEEWRND